MTATTAEQAYQTYNQAVSAARAALHAAVLQSLEALNGAVIGTTAHDMEAVDAALMVHIAAIQEERYRYRQAVHTAFDRFSRAL